MFKITHRCGFLKKIVMDKIELIISIREVRGTHERCVYYARLPAVERRGRVAIYGRRISKR